MKRSEFKDLMASIQVDMAPREKPVAAVLQRLICAINVLADAVEFENTAEFNSKIDAFVDDIEQQYKDGKIDLCAVVFRSMDYARNYIDQPIPLATAKTPGMDNCVRCGALRISNDVISQNRLCTTCWELKHTTTENQPMNAATG